MNRQTIYHEKQNKASLIVHDMTDLILSNYPHIRNPVHIFLGLSSLSSIIYEILLRRGVFKWFAARRKVIRLKHTWKLRATWSMSKQALSQGPNVNYWRGYRKALEECRAELREICKSPRWQAPDNDAAAQAWLKLYERGRV